VVFVCLPSVDIVYFAVPTGVSVYVTTKGGYIWGWGSGLGDVQDGVWGMGGTVRRARRAASGGLRLPLYMVCQDSKSRPVGAQVRTCNDIRMEDNRNVYGREGTQVTRTVATTNQRTTRRELRTDIVEGRGCGGGCWWVL